MELSYVCCPYCSRQHKWTFRGPPSVRLNSITGVAFCQACEKTVFLKHMLSPNCAESEDRAEHEFSVTTEIYEKFRQSPEMGVVKPLGRRKSMVLLEHIVGESPLYALKTGELKAGEVMMRRMAAWLAHLHQACGQTKGDIDFSERLTNISLRIERQKLRKPAASQALLYLQETFSRLSIDEDSHRLLHGDAKPDNFIFDGKRLVGFDIDGRFRNLPEYDLAQLMSQYELSSCSFTGQMNELRRQHLEAAFVDSYRQLMPVDTAVLKWTRVYFLLSFWLSWRAPSPLHRIRWDPLFNRRMQHCLGDSSSV